MIINKNITHFNYSIEKKWYIINAANQTLGRLSSKVAYILQGKNNIEYAPHIQNDTHVIIINSKLIRVTGNKRTQKAYKKHSGKPGSLKIETFDKLQARIPNRILEKAIKGMLPKNSIGRKMFTRIKIYANSEHPHSAQKPLLINEI
uniref:Large ribosomal subunit protein uL13c n=1 Tax=Caloglossa intermedia TaxID=100879 RepID=A0A1Z1M6Y4_9FLOR|nr:ribosomal protein L13 [Caloglossa intermedia]ARW61514.1 ribosomal protein L13 [Caloglossa intermedia]